MLQPLLLAMVFAAQSGDVLSAPALAKPVTFTTRAEDAVTAMKALGQVAGAPLAATQVMEPEILILRLDKVPLRDAMRKIADACGGSWSLEKSIYYLGRTTAEEQRRLTSARSSELAVFQKTITEAKARMTAAKPFDAAAAADLARQIKAYQASKQSQAGGIFDMKSLLSFSGQEPIGRLVDAVLSKVDAGTLLDTPIGRRAVFSTDPNEMELPLKIDATDAVAEFVTEENLWATAMKPIAANEVSNFPLPFATDNAIAEPIVKLDVVIDRTQQMGPSMELEVIGADGNVLATTQRQIVPDPAMPNFASFAAKAGEVKLAISSDELAEMQMLSIAMGDKIKQSPLSPAAQDRLDQPDRYDPLATYVSSLYLETAEAVQKNLVADVPDAYIMLGPTAGRITVPTATNWLNMTQSIGALIAPTSVDDKWIEIAGGRTAPTNQLALRANRHLLGNLFADAKMNGLTTEALARYAFESGQTSPDYMSVAKVATLAGNIEFSRWDTLRILGAMVARDGAAAIKSQTVPFTSLDTPTIDLLTEIVFYHHTNLNRMYRGSAGVPFAYHGTEACDAMPQGLPRDGSLTIDDRQSEVAYADGPRAQACNAQTLAWNTHMKNHPELFPANGAGPTIADKFRMGTERNVSVNIELKKDLALNLTYQEHDEPSGDAVPFKSLPAKFVADVQQALDRYEKAP